MDEYTPTTEDVRVMYASDEYGVEHEDDVAAFYRWLEQVIAEAEERGRLNALTNPAIERWVDARGGTTP